MRIMLAVTLMLGLCGCSSTDFFGDAESNSSATQSAAASDQAPSQASEADASPAPAMANTTSEAPVDRQARPAPVAQASASSSAHCTALAKMRAGDAAFQGDDPDTQESVYHRTYSDCVAWDLKHAFR